MSCAELVILKSSSGVVMNIAMNIEKKLSQGSSIVDRELSVLMPAPGFSHIQPCGGLCLLKRL